MTPPRVAFLLMLGWLSVQPAASAQDPGAPPGPVAPRIVNGLLTAAHPTTGALVSPADPRDAVLVCTGTMIGCRTFLTAAHCVCELKGADCPSAELDTSGHLVFLQHTGFHPLERVTVHPDYDFPDNDLAVVRLAEPVTGVRPTALPNATPGEGTPGTVVGFGRAGGSADDFGLKRHTWIETAACPIDLGPPLQLCWNFVEPIGAPGADGNTCNGDSGGPLFVDLGLGPVLAGVTSGGMTVDCLPPDESWDTNVHHFVDYVRAQAGADLDLETCGALSQVGDPATRVDGFSGLLGPQALQAAHVFEVPPGAAELRVTLNASEQPGNDFDLFVRPSAQAVPPALECSATGSSQWAACLFDDPVEGPWELLVQRVAGEGAYQVTATAFAPRVDPPEPGTPQTSKQQRCLKTQGKVGRKVASAEVTNARNCVKHAARGRTDELGLDFQTQTAQACLTNDVKDRVGKLARKAAKNDEKDCSAEPPDFGYAGAEALATEPVEQVVGLVGDLFGPDLDAALVGDAVSPEGADCQQELLRRAGDVYDAAVRTALAESKSALAAGAGNAGALATAIGSALLSDADGRIAKATSKLRKGAAKRCAPGSVALLFPGSCFDSAGTDTLAACAAERTLCRQCLAEEALRAFDLDCDQLDDATANASCD